MIAKPVPAKSEQITMSPPANSSPTDERLLPSVPQRYQHFLLLQNHLEASAVARENKGQDGEWLRNSYKKSLGLSDADFEALRASSQRLEAALKDNDDQVNALRPPASASTANSGSADAKPLGVEELKAKLRTMPPPSPEMRQLQQERESAIELEIATLKASLSPEGLAKIVDYVENHFLRGQASVSSPGNAPSRQPVGQETTR
jgi:hypothetical protein